MKNLVKLTAFAIFFIMFANASYALQVGKIEKLIKKSDIVDTATISISIKNVDTNDIVYELNSKKLLHPASTQKLFTTFASLDTLGWDYSFKTGFYKDGDNNLYIKLGADPLLTTNQIREALFNLKENDNTTFNNLYIDDSIIDKKEFATGWMFDDEVSPYTPKVSAYNLDKNVISVNMLPSQENFVTTNVKTTYPTAVYSQIKTGAQKENIEIMRYCWNNPELVEIYGEVVSPKTIKIPISSMRRYFIHNLSKGLEDARIKIEGTLYSSKLLPEDSQLLAEISNPVSAVIPSILQDSNNLMAESIFKLAASKKYNATGTTEMAIQLFEEFYGKNENIVVKDGSGVSRNNLTSVDWQTDTLIKLYKNKSFEMFKDKMAQPGDGTLSDRLFDLRGDAWLKTGSLSNVSTISGFVKSENGKLYVVSIIIQNFTKNHSDIKSFEDEIIKYIYKR